MEVKKFDIGIAGFAVGSLFILLILLLLLIFNVNQQNTDRVRSDPRIFQNPNCSASCWDGLEPGYSSDAEVRQYFIDTYPQYNIVNNDSFTYYQASASGLNINAYTSNGMLVGITLNAEYEFNIQLANILTTVGTSNYIAVGASIHDITRQPNALITLFYPDEGYIFHANLRNFTVSEDRFTNLCVEPDDYLFRIQIVRPGTINQVIADAEAAFAFGMSETQIQLFVDRLTPWSGFECTN
jgi:hypothetical protein